MGVFPTVIGGGSTIAPNSGLVSDLFSAINTGVQQDALSQSETFAQAGDTDEANAYGSAKSIAEQNARLALAAGGVEQAQKQLEISRTLGSQKAATAAGGFQQAGSALSVLRASTQQGALDQQLIGLNSQLKAGGFTEAATASGAEASAASTAASQAGILGKSAAAIAAASKTNAINEAAAMGLTVPGLDTLSATSIPAVNPVTLQQQQQNPVTGPNAPLNTNTGVNAKLTIPQTIAPPPAPNQAVTGLTPTPLPPVT